jgi:hypothetical protein
MISSGSMNALNGMSTRISKYARESFTSSDSLVKFEGIIVAYVIINDS